MAPGHTPFPRNAPELASISMSEHKARAVAKFRRPTKARSFWSSVKNCVRLQSRCDSAVRELY